VHFAELDSMVFLLKSEIRIVNSHEILVYIAKTNTEYGCSEAPIHVLHHILELVFLSISLSMLPLKLHSSSALVDHGHTEEEGEIDTQGIFSFVV
jgi:hypothetical protein